MCVITKSEILFSAQFNISPHYSFTVQINVSPAVSYRCNLSVGFCILVVYCEAVRSAILATAWLLVIDEVLQDLTRSPVKSSALDPLPT